MTDFTTTPDKPYTEVKSEHIKEKIRNSDFDSIEERKEVNKLIFLEKKITGEINLGYPSGMLYTEIKKDHQADYRKKFTESLGLKNLKTATRQKEKKKKIQRERKERQKRKEKKEVKKGKKRMAKGGGVKINPTMKYIRLRLRKYKHHIWIQEMKIKQ